ncbi:hemerythrin domain-containing protein [Nonomuraea sp. NPDC000554]|uniref:hemerythrin domain-containing protein n=1 Tax=Nonomuraea sp. NPDC000554 TaxID=3154259 RepID=UPI00332FBA2E
MMEAQQDGTGDAERVRAFGDELVAVHDWFRAELARLRTGEPLSGELRAHCVTFCERLSFHHSGEDRVAFPHLEERFPELKAALDRLRAEHVVVAGLVERLANAGTRDELDRLSAELEAHFDYEEKQLVPVLNSLDGVPWEVRR